MANVLIIVSSFFSERGVVGGGGGGGVKWGDNFLSDFVGHVVCCMLGRYPQYVVRCVSALLVVSCTF